ncbi:hypothetical protein KY284_005101 [Solanum tuberosum]|nr:hypothetical protein KY284_005101 [Solanum tuberosum]
MSLEDGLQRLRITFNLLIQHRRLVNKSKCSLGAARVEYDGHFITAEGVAFGPKKIAVVQEWPIPQPIKELRGWEGFHLNVKATMAFNQFKKDLVTAPVLSLLNNTQQFLVETNACDLGVGIVLMQEGHPLAYLSKGLSHRQKYFSLWQRAIGLDVDSD